MNVIFVVFYWVVKELTEIHFLYAVLSLFIQNVLWSMLITCQ